MPLAKAISVVAAVADDRATEEETNQMTAMEAITGRETIVPRPTGVARKGATAEMGPEATAQGPTGPAQIRQKTTAS